MVGSDGRSVLKETGAVGLGEILVRFKGFLSDSLGGCLRIFVFFESLFFCISGVFVVPFLGAFEGCFMFFLF